MDLQLPWHKASVRLSDIHVPVYQRAVQHSLVKQIVTQFDPRRLQPLVVNLRADNQVYVIDGQQRLTALRQLGHNDVELDCILYSGLSEAEEAFVYTATQETGSRRILLPIQQLRGAYYAGDPEAIEITQVVEGVGLELNEHQAVTATNLHAIASVRRIYRRGGGAHLRAVLLLVMEAYPETPGVGYSVDPNRGRLNGMILQGASLFMLRYAGRYDRARLVNVLQRAGLAELRERTGDYRRVVHTGRWEVAVSRAIRHLYNARLSTGALPDLDELAGHVTQEVA